jgi:AcrR family transcriptional regulator
VTAPDVPNPTRDRILEAAAERLRRAPLMELTLSGVARSAQLSRQTAYQHFRDRDDLVASVFVAYAEQHLVPAHRRLSDGRLGLAALERLFWADVAAARSYFGEGELDAAVRTSIADFILGSPRMRDYQRDLWVPTLERFRAAGVLVERPGLEALERWLSYQQTWLVAHPAALDDERALVRELLLRPLLVA